MKKTKFLTPLNRSWKKLLLTMKLCLLFILISATSLMASSGYSQNTTLTIHLKNATLRDLIQAIEDQSEFIFVLSDEVVNLDKPIDIQFKNKTVDKILDEVFKSSELTYRIFDRQIGIGKRNPETGIMELPKSLGELVVIDKELTGIVKDTNGDPIPGATVIVKGTTIGTVTDADGRFVLKIPPEAKILSVSFVGFQSQDIPIDNLLSFNIVLKEQTVGIDEVVAVGYSQQKKVTITGSVSSVRSEEIAQISTPTLGDGILGKVSGISMTTAEGTPGASDAAVFIRGIGTLNSAEPLFIIDGVPESKRTFMQLSPSSIQDLSILKDASATAVYGVRGANGVIIVKTKRGELGKTTIDAQLSYGNQIPTQLLNFANSYEWAQAYNEQSTNDNKTDGYISDEIIEHYKNLDQPLLYSSSNWVKEVLNNAAPQTMATVNISGGDKKIRYFTSVSYLYQDGIVKQYGPAMGNFSYNRFNLQTNIDVDITPTTTLSFTARGRYGVRKEPQPVGTVSMNTLWERLYSMPPMNCIGIVDGRFVVPDSRYLPEPIAFRAESFMEYLYRGDTRSVSENLFNFNLDFRQKFEAVSKSLKGLDFRMKIGYRAGFDRNKIAYGPLAQVFTTIYNKDAVNPNPDISPNEVVFIRSTENTNRYWKSWYDPSRYIYFEAGFDYAKSFGDHNITALALYNQNKDYFPPTTWAYSNIPTGNVGLVGRLTYDYRTKYLLEFNVGYNGSENFARDQRFGLFPSVSAGWIPTEEKWMPKISGIDYIKLRGSYGIVGNDQVGGTARFIYIGDSYNRDLTKWYGYNFGQNIPEFSPGVIEDKVGNSNVTWEKATKQNYGIDMVFFDGGISLNVDYSVEHRDNILTYSQSAPGFLAMDLPPVNIGKMENKGFDVSLSWQEEVGDFKFSLEGNISRYRNKIIYMDELPPVEPYQSVTGHHINYFYGYVCDGFYSNEEISIMQDEIAQEIDPSDRTYAVPIAAHVQAGDLKYRDLNNDGIINDVDRKVIEKPYYPQITGGLNGRLSYKGFDMSFGLQGVAEVSRILPYRTPMGGSSENSLWLPFYQGRWTPEKWEAGTVDWPRFTQNNKVYNSQTSTFWVRDASFIRLKRAELGYSFKNIPIFQSFRVYIQGNNLFTWQKDEYKWQDPEIMNQTYPLMKMYNIGVQIKF